MDKGDRVKIHPTSEAFLAGERYGTVESVGRIWVRIIGDRSGKLFRLPPWAVQPVDPGEKD